MKVASFPRAALFLLLRVAWCSKCSILGACDSLFSSRSTFSMIVFIFTHCFLFLWFRKVCWENIVWFIFVQVFSGDIDSCRSFRFTRLLSPGEYGVYSLTIIVVGFLNTVFLQWVALGLVVICLSVVMTKLGRGFWHG